MVLGAPNGVGIFRIRDGKCHSFQHYPDQRCLAMSTNCLGIESVQDFHITIHSITHDTMGQILYSTLKKNVPKAQKALTAGCETATYS